MILSAYNIRTWEHEPLLDLNKRNQDCFFKPEDKDVVALLNLGFCDVLGRSIFAGDYIVPLEKNRVDTYISQVVIDPDFKAIRHNGESAFPWFPTKSLIEKCFIKVGSQFEPDSNFSTNLYLLQQLRLIQDEFQNEKHILELLAENVLAGDSDD